MKNYKYAALAALASTVSIFATPAIHARPMTAEDLTTLKRVGAPAISPDGKSMAFTVTSTDLKENKRKTEIYWQSLTVENATPKLLKTALQSKTSSHSPIYSADGRSIYYISDETKSEQIWRYDIPAAGGIPSTTQISDFTVDISGFKLSSDNRKIAIWADVSTDCSDLNCDKEIANKDTARPGPGTGREYDKTFVRHWGSWEKGNHLSRLFTYDLGTNGLSNGRLISTQIGDTPSKPFGGGEEIAITEDQIFYTLRIADEKEPRSTNLDIYWKRVIDQEMIENLRITQVARASDKNEQVSKKLDIDERRAIAQEAYKSENITSDNSATDTMPTPSPDGRYIAYLAMKRAGYESDKLSLKIIDLDSRTIKNITENWDRSVGSISWSTDSKSLYITAQDILDHPVYKIAVTGGTPKRLSKGGNVNNVVALKDGSIVYTKNDINSPNEIFHFNEQAGEKKLTSINDALLAEIDKVNVQRFDFAGANGDQVWGQIIKPIKNPKIIAGEKLPVAFLVHGGPQGSFGNSWSFRWNPKVMASQGYVAITVDFHGSVGYGQKFTDSINQDWGGKPLTDLKLGLAAAGKIDPQADTQNACALGASYGGYMMNWIAGNWSDEFKCIVNHAGLFDLRQFAFETEELWFDEWDHGGPWWARKDSEKWNPVNHVTKWKTPMLVIHGELDFRVPYSQSIAAFTALQRQDIESKLLIFPDENHWINKPNNSLQWHKNVFGWLKKYTAEE